MAKGEAHVGKMDAILTDSHIDTRIKICHLMNDRTKTRLCRRNMKRERTVRKTPGNSTYDGSEKSARMLKYE